MRTSLILASMLAICSFAVIAQEFPAELETLDQQERELPSIPSVQGAITIIKPAALVFAKFDSDFDYIVSESEAKIGVSQTFARADRDGNGRISLFELEDWRNAALGSLDALPGNLSFDIDYDNQVVEAEFETALMKLFDRHDEDESGGLNSAELVRVLEVPRPKGPVKEKLSDRECAAQIQRNRSRF